MDEEKQEFTVRQIVILALEQYKIITEDEETYKIDAKIETVTKKVREIIKNRKLKSVGTAKSTETAKRPAKTYSKESKNSIVNEYLFDYLITMTKDEAVKKTKSPQYFQKKAQELNAEYEDAIVDFLNLSSEQQNNLLNSRKSVEQLTEFSKEVRLRKIEIMLEALFSKYYLLNSRELVEDFNKVNAINAYKTENFDGDDIRMLEKFRKWQNYVKDK